MLGAKRARGVERREARVPGWLGPGVAARPLEGEPGARQTGGPGHEDWRRVPRSTRRQLWPKLTCTLRFRRTRSTAWKGKRPARHPHWAAVRQSEQLWMAGSPISWGGCALLRGPAGGGDRTGSMGGRGRRELPRGGSSSLQKPQHEPAGESGGRPARSADCCQEEGPGILPGGAPRKHWPGPVRLPGSCRTC